MCAAGLFTDKPRESARIACEISLKFLEAVEEYNVTHAKQIKVRIGMNTGPCIGGVIGKDKQNFDIWGQSGK